MSERLKNNSAADPAQHFRIDHLKTDLKGKSIRGGATTLSSQIFKYALQMAATVVISCLLTPQDYAW